MNKHSRTSFFTKIFLDSLKVFLLEDCLFTFLPILVIAIVYTVSKGDISFIRGILLWPDISFSSVILMGLGFIKFIKLKTYYQNNDSNNFILTVPLYLVLIIISVIILGFSVFLTHDWIVYERFDEPVLPEGSYFVIKNLQIINLSMALITSLIVNFTMQVEINLLNPIRIISEDRVYKIFNMNLENIVDKLIHIYEAISIYKKMNSVKLGANYKSQFKLNKIKNEIKNAQDIINRINEELKNE